MVVISVENCSQQDIYLCIYNYLTKGTLKQMCMIEDALSMIKREKVQPLLLVVQLDFDVLCL